MQKLSLVNLETLCWIHRLGTFTAAAQRLNTTQPAVSNRVKELEQALGIRLFQRRGRTMELTVQGRHLVERAQPLLSGLEDLAASLDNAAAATGTIRMGVGEIVAMSWLAALVARLKQRMPRVRYEIEVDLTVNMRQKLELGRLDLAIVAAPLDSHRLTETYVGSVAARWLIAPSLLADAGPQPVDVAALLQRHPVWCVARPSQMYPMVAQTLRSFGVPPDDINTSDNIQSIVEVVANRAGIALVPDSLAAAHARDGRVVPLSDALPPQRLDFVVAMHRDENQGVLREIARCAAEVSPFERVAQR